MTTIFKTKKILLLLPLLFFSIEKTQGSTTSTTSTTSTSNVFSRVFSKAKTLVTTFSLSAVATTGLNLITSITLPQLAILGCIIVAGLVLWKYCWREVVLVESLKTALKHAPLMCAPIVASYIVAKLLKHFGYEKHPSIQLGFVVSIFAITSYIVWRMAFREPKKGVIDDIKSDFSWATKKIKTTFSDEKNFYAKNKKAVIGFVSALCGVTMIYFSYNFLKNRGDDKPIEVQGNGHIDQVDDDELIEMEDDDDSSKKKKSLI